MACARHGTEAQRTGVADAVTGCRGAGDDAELVATDERFWRLTAEYSGNLAFQLSFNSLVAGLHRLGPVAYSVSCRSTATSPRHERVASAIRRGHAQTRRGMPVRCSTARSNSSAQPPATGHERRLP